MSLAVIVIIFFHFSSAKQTARKNPSSTSKDYELIDCTEYILFLLVDGISQHQDQFPFQYIPSNYFGS